MKVKTIDIEAREWWDRVNGNSYFDCSITVNHSMKSEENFYLPMQYGYGDQYETEAKFTLMQHGVIEKTMYGIAQYCRENNIILRRRKIENCKKSDLKE